MKNLEKSSNSTYFICMKKRRGKTEQENNRVFILKTKKVNL